MTETVPEQALDATPGGALLDRAGSAAPAFTYLEFPGGHRTEHTLSWARLAERVRSVAAVLRQHAGPGDRVALLARQDLGYVVGFLATLHAGLIAVPLFAPERRAHSDRLVGALRDAAPRVWLTGSAQLDRTREFGRAHDIQPAKGALLAVDTVPVTAADDPAPPGREDPAYLQYSSGSTRTPTAAVISHRALAASCWQVATAYDVDARTTCTGWIPFFHDMGLIQLLCVPALTGARSVFFTPVEFVRRPGRWLHEMATHPRVFTAAPNFAYDLAVEETTPQERAGWDLSGVRVALNGSEPVRAATVARFADVFGAHGFSPAAHRPSYGLAEATVYVSSAGACGPTVTAFDRIALGEGRAVPGTTRELVSVGKPVGQLVRIVDPERHTVCPDGAVGEIWVRGPHLASGYWRRPGATAEAFGALVRDPPEGTPARGWLRTGDLGLIHDGLLYITGRIKDLIVVDGRNHYPQDIEATVADAHPAIRRGRVAAFGIRDGDGEAVAVLAEHVPGASLDPVLVAKAVRRAVSEGHEVALRGFRLGAPGTVPRTSSGKVARAAAKARFESER